MSYVVPVAILVFCLPAVFIPAARVQTIIWIAFTALLIGIIGCSWPYIMPRNFLINYPWAVDSPLHPEIAIFWGGVALLFAFGLGLSLGCRLLLLYFRIIKAT